MNREKKIITFIIIFFVVFFSCFLVNKTFSRYRSNVIGSGETDIAKWELLINGDDNSINLVPGGSAVNYILRVTSKSNVSSNYSIELSDLPSDVKVSLDNGAYRVPVNGVITFSNCGNLNATSSSTYNDHTLSFMAINGAGSVTNREVNIDIIAEQDNI
jgi:hypothetical protein